MLLQKADELFPRPEESVQSQEGKPTNLTGNTDADTSSEADIAKEIQDEIAELESERKKDSVEPAMNLSKAARKRTFRQGRFAHLNFGVQAMTLIVCLVCNATEANSCMHVCTSAFVTQDSNIDVVKVVDALCEKAKLEKQFPSRFVQRMVPIQKLVKSNIDNVMTAVKELVQGTNLASENPETVSSFSKDALRHKSTHTYVNLCRSVSNLSRDSRIL